MPSPSPQPSPVPRAAFAALVVGVLAYAAVHAAGDATAGVRYWILPPLCLGAAALVLLRVLRDPRDRLAWSLLAAGMTLYATGSLIHAAGGGRATVDVPVAAYLAWLGFYVLASGAVVALLHRRMRSLAATLALDGLVLGLTLAAISSALLLDLAQGVNGIGGAVAVFNLAYGAADVLLLSLVLWAAWLGGRRGARMWLTLAGGVGLLLAGDIAVDLDALIGGDDRGGVTRALYPAGLVALAWAAFQPVAPARRPRIDSLAIIALPGAAVVIALALETYDELHALPSITEHLLILILATAFVRAVVTYRQLRRLKDGRRFQRGFEQSAIGMALASPDGIWLRVNEAFCTMVGRRPDELVGTLVSDLRHPSEQAGRGSAQRRAVALGAVPSYQRRLQHADGGVVETQCSSVYVDEDGDQPYHFIEVQDVTERNRALRQSAALAELGRLAIEEADADLLLVRALPAVARAVDAGSCEVLPAGEVPDGTTLQVPLRRRQRVAAQVLVASSRTPSRGGEEHDALFLQAVADVLAGALDRADAETDTRRRALHDPLTGLANRTFLTAHLEQQLAAASRGDGALALLLLDVDRFKMVNDTFGHSAGDELLVEVAQRLRAVTRRADLVARLGGDEFVVACRHGRPEDTGALAERIVSAFEEPFLVGGRELVLGASVGVATDAEGEGAAEALLRNADVAMYRAKDQGGDRYVVFDDALRAGVVRRLTLEVALRQALDRGELELHYQPVVKLDDESLHGFEALLRWHHPEHGDVSPVDFIPIAEDTGLISPIGAWVIDEAFRQLSEWNALRPGAPLRMGVNLSPAQLTTDLVAEVRTALQRHRLAPQWIVMEITESLLIEGEGANDVLARLRALGVDIALDDFGTGYSSLGYISEYALDVVKLDRTLIARLGTSSRARGLVRGVVEMAHALDMHVLAEGLENQAQAEAARDLGCALGQGWLYSKALPAADATHVAAERVPSTLAL